MKTIGLIGGMSWESTASYYKSINEGIRDQQGGLSSAKLVLSSLDFAEIGALQSSGEWEAIGALVSEAAKGVEAGGADFCLICTNTIHKMAETIQSSISIPLISIVDVTAERMVADGVSTVGLLGTRFTMEQDFYKEQLLKDYGIQTLVPEQADIETVHRIIYQELCLGQVTLESRLAYEAVMERLQARGAEGIILGCTEIPLLIQQEHTSIRLYDTTQLHANKAVQLALS